MCLSGGVFVRLSACSCLCDSCVWCVVRCCVAPCCAVLCCGVACCVVVCCGMCVVLCCGVVCCVVLCCVVSCWVALWCAVLCCVVCCCVVLSCAVLCCGLPRCGVFWRVALRCVALCCVVWWCVVLCWVVWFCGVREFRFWVPPEVPNPCRAHASSSCARECLRALWRKLAAVADSAACICGTCRHTDVTQCLICMLALQRAMFPRVIALAPPTIWRHPEVPHLRHAAATSSCARRAHT